MVNGGAEDGSAGRLMDNRTALPETGADDFARRFSLRAGNLMWLLGAGASAAAGIPTAGDMIWGFKQRLFISQRPGSRQTGADLSKPAIRAQLEAPSTPSGDLPPSRRPRQDPSPLVT